MSTDIEVLNQFLNPQAGRMIRSNGDIWNAADFGQCDELCKPCISALKGDCYNFQIVTPDLATGASHYISVVTNPTKHSIVFARPFEAEEGPMTLYTVLGATYTEGTPVNVSNFFRGKAASGTQVTSGVTNVSGGIEVVVDSLFGAGNNNAVASIDVSIPSIFPPGTEFLLKITSGALGSNKAKLAFAFSEVELCEDLV